MPTVTITTLDGVKHPIVGRVGNTLMETIRDHGIDELQAICGGSCSCATCHVYIDDAVMFAALPPIGPDENALLSGSDYRQAQSRLSCQVPLAEGVDGMSVTIAPPD